MEDSYKLIETLLEKATEYGKSTYELTILKTIEKTSDVVSSLIPHSLVFIFIISCFLFVNLGLAFWIGEFIGSIYLGFLIIAAIYFLISFVLYFFAFKCIKRSIRNYLIKIMLK
jgi:hypothetical protein